MTTPTTSTKASTLPLPAPYTSSPYRFIVQHTTVGSSTSLLYAGLASGSVSSASSAGPSGSSDKANGQKLDAYQLALQSTATGPDSQDLDVDTQADEDDVRVLPGCRNLGTDWAVGFPSRSVSVIVACPQISLMLIVRHIQILTPLSL